jgi:hypothetical protein
METGSESKRNLTIAALPFLCLGGVFLNILTWNLFRNALGVPLFMDTIFTVAMTLYGGLVCGVFTGLLTNLIGNMLNFSGWVDILYALCNVAVALVTFFFIRLFPAELRFGAGQTIKTGAFETAKYHSRLMRLMNTLVVLLLLSFVMCIVISILGGLIAVFIKFVWGTSKPGPEFFFKLALLRKTLPPAIVEILARIPLNIIDRLLSVLGGYGVAALLWRLLPR